MSNGFGGLYLNNLRHATYSNLIKSTSISEKNIYGENYFIKKNIDFDMDGRDEVIIYSEKETLIFHSLSGSLIEWDLKKENPINLIDTLKRREEAYHISAMRNTNNNNQNEGHVSIHEIAKKVDEKIAKYLVFDKNEKVFGVDHFLNKMPSAKLMDPIIIDLPAPVSPDRILSPSLNSTSVSFISARFFTCRFCNIYSPSTLPKYVYVFFLTLQSCEASS